jgi:excisionase family DNA binding protein
MPDPDLFTVQEAAALGRVDEQWWRRRIADGTCPVRVYRLGRHIRLDRNEVLAWLEAQVSA